MSVQCCCLWASLFTNLNLNWAEISQNQREAGGYRSTLQMSLRKVCFERSSAVTLNGYYNVWIECLLLNFLKICFGIQLKKNNKKTTTFFSLRGIINEKRQKQKSRTKTKSHQFINQHNN